MDPTLQDDPDILALKRAAAAKRRNTLIIGVAAIAMLPLYWLMGFSNVRASLEQEGYTDVQVSAAGAFEYTFDAKRGGSECKGRVTRLPFSSSKSSFCYSVDASGKASGSTESSGE
jgi:hypothetical protein